MPRSLELCFCMSHQCLGRHQPARVPYGCLWHPQPRRFVLEQPEPAPGAYMTWQQLVAAFLWRTPCSERDSCILTDITGVLRRGWGGRDRSWRCLGMVSILDDCSLFTGLPDVTHKCIFIYSYTFFVSKNSGVLMMPSQL